MPAARFFATLTILSGVAIQFFFHLVKPDGVPCSHVEMILCAELPASAEHLQQLITAPENLLKTWKGSLLSDFGFLVGYCGLLCVGAITFVSKTSTRRLALFTAVSAGICDATENVGLLWAVSDPGGITQSLSKFVYISASIKFALLSATVLIIATGVDAKNSWSRMALAVAAVLGLISLVGQWFWPLAIDVSALAVFITCLTVLVTRFKN